MYVLGAPHSTHAPRASAHVQLDLGKEPRVTGTNLPEAQPRLDEC
jgi:hypothetical protein